MRHAFLAAALLASLSLPAGAQTPSATPAPADAGRVVVPAPQRDGRAMLEDAVARATAGSVEAQLEVGQIYMIGLPNVPVDEVQAVLWLSRAAEGGSAAAGNLLGDFHYHGRGTPTNRAKARDIWLGSAIGGNAEARVKLGGMLLAGRDIPGDPEAGLFWMTLAARGEGRLATLAKAVASDAAAALPPEAMQRVRARVLTQLQAEEAAALAAR